MSRALWRIEVFGGLCARQGAEGRGRAVTRFQSRQTGLLLAYLAYHRRRSPLRDELIELLWPECDLDQGRHRLSQALSSLRHQLEPPGVPAGTVLTANRHAIGLNPEVVATDVAEFEEALQAAAKASSQAEGRHWLKEAVERYHGELLPGYYQEWCLTQRQALAELYARALLQLVDQLSQDGDFESAIRYALRAVTADPLREEAHRELIRLYAAAGQPSTALRQYRELERILEEALAEAPSAATRALIDEIQEAGVPAFGRSGVPTTTDERPTTNDGSSPFGIAERPNVRTPERRNATAPIGTVTFLLTDIEGSTALWERTGERFRRALASHHEILRRVFRDHGGYEAKEIGDGFLVAFEGTGDALACAVAGQRALASEPWSAEVGPVRVRMALHTGDVHWEGGEYHSLVLHHASRILVTAHGGQILCSEVTTGLLRRSGLVAIEAGVQLDELGVYRLRNVEAPERLFQVQYPGMPQREFPPLKALPGYLSHLPPQLTRFFGRRQELAHLGDLGLGGEDRARLLTLTGPGGTGKTRLAIEAAELSVQQYEGAVWFVPLADVSDPAQIVESVLDVMRVERLPEIAPERRLLQELSRQPTLLVLDNFEQLVPAGAAVVQQLLEGVPDLTCLVTSRRALGLSGEREFPVGPLPTPGPGVQAFGHSGVQNATRAGAVPDPERLNARTPERLMECASVQLFVTRAQAVRPDFQVTRANAPAVAELCDRLEGIPLAIELAAARALILTPAQLLQRLRRRLDLLVSRRPDVAPRHRTLRAAIDGSYQLLAPELQQFFAGLSVFRGGWSLEAAEAGGEELALDYLMQLREGSLVLAEDRGTEMRFRMLESLREYAAEQHEATPDAEASSRQRHAEYFHRFAVEQVRQLRTPGETAALQRFEADFENVRAAMEWSQQAAQHERCAEIALALGMFLQRRGFQREALTWIDLGLAAARQAGREQTLSYAELLREQAGLSLDRSEPTEAHRLASEALAHFQQLGDAHGMAEAANLLGLAAKGQRDLAEARRHFAAALEQFERAGDRVGIAMVRSNLGVVAYLEGGVSRVEAARHWQESLRLHRANGDVRGTAEVLNNLGALDQEEGRLEEAWRSYEEALEIEQELRHGLGVGRTLSNLGEVAELQGELQRACRLFAAAEALFEKLGSPHRQYTAELLSRVASRAGCTGAALEALRGGLKGRSDDDLTRWALADERIEGGSQG